MRNRFAVLAVTAIALSGLNAFGTAMAAEPVVYVPPPAAAPPLAPAVYDWSGFYLGAHAGYAFGEAESLPAPPLTGIGDTDVDGPFIGGQVGFNFGNRFIIGIEADYSWAGIDGTIVAPPVGPDVTLQEIDSIYTVRGKVGFPMGSNGQILPYLTGGWGWAEGTRTTSDGGGQVATNTHDGWNAGVGVDFGVSENITVGVLYLYQDLSAETYIFPVGNDPLIDINLHSLSLRVNFLF